MRVCCSNAPRVPSSVTRRVPWPIRLNSLIRAVPPSEVRNSADWLLNGLPQWLRSWSKIPSGWRSAWPKQLTSVIRRNVMPSICEVE